MSFQKRWRNVRMLLAVVACCGAMQAYSATVLDVRLANASVPINVSVGQALRVHLPASPATGYEWVLEDGVPSSLRLETDPGRAPANVQTWEFRAERSGQAALRFVYRRPWEVRSMHARTAHFDVIVH